MRDASQHPVVLVSDPVVSPRLRKLWLDAAALESLDVVEMPAHRLSLRVDENKTEVLFDGDRVTPSAVVWRTAGIFMPLLTLLDSVWRQEGVLILNPASSVNLARDKVATALKLGEMGVPFVYTLGFYRGGVIRGIDGAVIIKPANGSQGLGVREYNDVEKATSDLGSVVEARTEGHLVAQPFSGPRGHDMRCFVVNNKCVAMTRRHAAGGEFINNVSRGARMESVFSKEAAELSVRATSALGLFYAGVDLVETEPMRVLEVNSLPSFTGLFEATGVNPAIYVWRAVKERLHAHTND